MSRTVAKGEQLGKDPKQRVKTVFIEKFSLEIFIEKSLKGSFFPSIPPLFKFDSTARVSYKTFDSTFMFLHISRKKS